MNFQTYQQVRGVSVLKKMSCSGKEARFALASANARSIAALSCRVFHSESAPSAEFLSGVSVDSGGFINV